MNKNISEATPEDWKDFWENEDTVGDDIVVNMDGGVGGSWKVDSVPLLEENDGEIFSP